MTVETFFANFGHLTDAPNGVQKLREMILQLAVQGKLVPQDPSDEPASVLLERILSLKQQLIKDKKLRKTKIPMAYDGDGQVELPPSWVYTTLYDVGEIAPRNVAEDESKASFVPMPLISEFYGVTIQSETRAWGEIRSGFTHFAEGDVCLAKITPCYQNGKSAVMRGLYNGIGAGTTELHVFRGIEDTVCSDYVLVFLKSPLFIKEGIPRMTGSAGQKRITRDYFAGKPFPLPPLEEQKRIVAKVDQLMALCDELEARQQKQQQGRVCLNNAALDALLTARDPDEFADHWQRICTNFDLLYDHPETIAKLRAAILQLAVQGKLVPQDPSDEPASVLLERVKAEKERLVKEGKVKKQKPLPAFSNDEIPFELSNGWDWARGEMLAAFVDPHPSHRTPPEFAGGVPYVGYSEIDHVKGIDFSKARKVNPKVFEEHQERYQLKVGDFVFGKIGTLGEPFFISEPFDYCLSANLILIQPNLSIVIPEYLAYYLESPAFLKILGNTKTNSTHGVFGIKKARLIAVPLPPFEEQKRIVAKVDQLMALCDELEAKLNQAQQHSEKLMEATVRQLLVA